ncbi:MAG: VWA domain-containing protein [Dehalococcoidia bacterium]|nr:VWA domain-containing protein [Dehalococcoidia bacterium]MCB9484135.1 VWA domain-containing protein [Dehalococcoidia bacterium]MCB9491185.1 VWA domain-containing protein [Dehalococcoidia bacterium]
MTIPQLIRRRILAAHRDERGQALPLLIAAMGLFVVMGVLVVDVGMFSAERRTAQTAVDLAALAAAQDLPSRSGDPDQATKLAAAQTSADSYLAANGFLAGDPEVSTSVVTSYGGDPTMIEVSANREFNWLFGGIFGIGAGQVGARAVATANAQPRDIVLILDTSGSMCLETHGGPMLNCPNPPGDPDHNGQADWEPFDTMREASLELGTVLTPTAQGGQTLDRIALVTYSTSATVQLPFTNDYDAGSPYESAINGIVPAGYTNIGYALYRARQIINSSGRPEASKVVVLLTDGYANRYRTGGSDSNPTFSTCSSSTGCSAADNYALTEAGAVATTGASIYTIGYTGGAGAPLLQSIANVGLSQGGGGDFFSVEDKELLAETFFEIASLTRVALLE